MQRSAVFLRHHPVGGRSAGELAEGIEGVDIHLVGNAAVLTDSQFDVDFSLVRIVAGQSREPGAWSRVGRSRQPSISALTSAF